MSRLDGRDQWGDVATLYPGSTALPHASTVVWHSHRITPDPAGPPLATRACEVVTIETNSDHMSFRVTFCQAVTLT